MPHIINPDPHYVEDESVQWNFTVTESGSAKDISGSTLEWYLLPYREAADGDATLDDSSTGVDLSFTSDGTDGRFDLVINQDTTTNVSAGWQRVKVDDSGSGLQKWGGPFPVEQL